MRFLAAIALLFCLPTALESAALGQDAPTTPPQDPIFRARTNLVLVPSLVRTKSGEPVYTLTADQFLLTDDGLPQKVSIEEDTDSQPLALVVAVELGGAGGRHLDSYRNIGNTVEAMVGNVPHKVAVVGFDSQARILADFTPDFGAVATTLHDLEPGDSGAAIFDGLGFSVELLRKQPSQYRRAILLLSETIDHGSQLKLEDTLHRISDTNTAIYSFGFSSSKSDVAHEAAKTSNSTPGPAGGCMAKDPNADPLDSQGKLSRAWECLSVLAPPLRAATIAAIIGMNGLKRNVPESVAQLTGGEFYSFKDTRTLERGMLTLANHIPNRYVLSFHPQSPHPGAHLIGLKLKDYSNLEIIARKTYWADSDSAGGMSAP